jgi:hypothetical protein
MTTSKPAVVVLALILASSLFSLQCTAADDSTVAAKIPTEAAITDACGARLSKIFSQFGDPVDLAVYHGSTERRDAVILDYATFGFDVREKIVRACRFWPEWQGTVNGIKIGASRDEVLKKLGSKFTGGKNDDGSETLFWPMKDPDLQFIVDFNKDGKSYLARVELK